jgi:proteasome lid subunit RPN8/RPN11
MREDCRVSDPRSISIPPDAEAVMRAHGASTYPHEACGVLVGRGDGEVASWVVVRAEPAPNEFDGGHHNRYLVAPAFQADVERRALDAGLDVIGFYHSHPDEAARPSEYDRSHAYAGYVYRVYAVHGGLAVEGNSFTLDAPGGSFQPVADATASPATQTES